MTAVFVGIAWMADNQMIARFRRGRIRAWSAAPRQMTRRAQRRGPSNIFFRVGAFAFPSSEWAGRPAAVLYGAIPGFGAERQQINLVTADPS